MLSVLMILLAAALPQRGALRHIIRTAPLRPPAPGAARTRPNHGPHQGRTGPRFLGPGRAFDGGVHRPAGHEKGLRLRYRRHKRYLNIELLKDQMRGAITAQRLL